MADGLLPTCPLNPASKGSRPQLHSVLAAFLILYCVVRRALTPSRLPICSDARISTRTNGPKEMVKSCRTQSLGQTAHPAKHRGLRQCSSAGNTGGKDALTKLPTSVRVSLTGVGALFIIVLATATRLEPDPRGLGTHQALGLPPCTFQGLLGSRCPACGMTTSWSYFVRGEIVKSLAANAAGTLLATIAIISAPWMLTCALTGRWLGYEASRAAAFVATVTVPVVALIQWGLRNWIL